MLRAKEYFAEPKVLLAPMAGVTDRAFRRLALEQGADLTFTEMVSSKGLSYANEKTKHLLDLAPEEKLVSVQLFGHEPDVMASTAAWVEDVLGENLAFLDINMGCPARKIVTKGDGSALMKTPELAAEIVTAVNRAVSHDVTVKFRRGYELEQETAVEFARRMEQAGAAAVAVHGRYAEQLYRGCADWGVIARVQEAVHIPVIGNGDIKSGEDARRMLTETGCSSVMIGRAAEGNPWIFADVQAVLGGQEPPHITLEERMSLAKRHAHLLSAEEGKTIVRMRRHAMAYVAGMPGAASARGRINACVTVDDFDELFDELLELGR